MNPFLCFTLLAIGQWGAGGCPTGLVGPSYIPVEMQTQDHRVATIRITVTPPDGEVWLDKFLVPGTGLEQRTVCSPPLEPKYTYGYHVKVIWPDATKESKLWVKAGQTYDLTLVKPDATGHVTDGTEQFNFGVYMPKDRPQQEVVTLNGKTISKDQAKQLMENGLKDDSGKPHLTIIGPDEDRKKVLADLRGPLADLVKEYLVQDYPASHWTVKQVGFKTDGKPTIYVQDATGKVLHRQDDYADGKEGLNKVLTEIRKPDPNYNPTKDPDLRRSAVLGLPSWVLVALGVLAFVFLMGRKQGESQ